MGMGCNPLWTIIDIISRSSAAIYAFDALKWRYELEIAKTTHLVT
jgi:hypothetical protein